MRSARQHNLRQREPCSARPKPHNPLNLHSVVVLALLDPLVLPPEQGSVPLASNNHSSSHSNRPGPGLVRLLKLNHNNRQASALVDSVPRSRSNSRSSNNNNPVVSLAQVALLSVKNPPEAVSVRVFPFKLAHVTDIFKAPQLQVLVLLVPEPESLVRRSPRPQLPSVLLPNNPRQVRSAPGDSAPVSLETETRLLSLNLTRFS